MTTYLLNTDNSITRTLAGEAIIEKSNCVDEIYFIAEKEYKGFLMKEFDLVLEYSAPISKSVRIETLTLVDEDYKEQYLKYSLPSTTDITGESGTVEMNLSFMKTELDADGNKIRRVRNFTPASLNIVPLSSWFHVSDEGLSQLAELYLSAKEQILALQKLAGMLYDTKADDISVDIDGKKLRLKSNGQFINDGVPLEVLNQELVEVGGDTTGNVKIQEI